MQQQVDHLQARVGKSELCISEHDKSINKLSSEVAELREKVAAAEKPAVTKSELDDDDKGNSVRRLCYAPHSASLATSEYG